MYCCIVCVRVVAVVVCFARGCLGSSSRDFVGSVSLLLCGCMHGFIVVNGVLLALF